MSITCPPCPYCGAETRLIRIPTRVKRGERVLSVPLETFECRSTCRSEDRSRPFAFINQVLGRANDAQIKQAWLDAFGEEIPAPLRPGRKSPEPRNQTIQLRLSSRELREIDRLRGELTRSEYIRSQALAGDRRSA